MRLCQIGLFTSAEFITIFIIGISDSPKNWNDEIFVNQYIGGFHNNNEKSEQNYKEKQTNKCTRFSLFLVVTNSTACITHSDDEKLNYIIIETHIHIFIFFFLVFYKLSSIYLFTSTNKIQHTQ